MSNVYTKRNVIKYIQLCGFVGRYLLANNSCVAQSLCHQEVVRIGTTIVPVQTPKPELTNSIKQSIL